MDSKVCIPSVPTTCSFSVYRISISYVKMFSPETSMHVIKMFKFCYWDLELSQLNSLDVILQEKDADAKTIM